MDTISRYYGGERRKFSIYSQAEADALGIAYVPWREAIAGQWVLSDDGYVGECLKIDTFPGDSGVILISFSFARQWAYPNSKLTYLDRVANRAWSTSSTKHWTELEVRRKRTKKAILAYSMMFLSGAGIDWPKIGIIYRKDWEGNSPGGRMEHYFKYPAFKKAVQDKMMEILVGRGKTKENVFEMLDAAFAMAEKNKDPKTMRAVAVDYAEMMAMFPAKTGKRMLPAHLADEVEDASFIEIENSIETAQGQLPAATSAPVPVAPVPVAPLPPQK